jgi:hypothetical protein
VIGPDLAVFRTLPAHRLRLASTQDAEPRSMVTHWTGTCACGLTWTARGAHAIEAAWRSHTFHLWRDACALAQQAADAAAYAERRRERDARNRDLFQWAAEQLAPPRGPPA